MDRTTTGTGIQVQDQWSALFPYPDYATEGVWTTAGLACVSEPRNSLYDQSEVVCGGVHKPLCPESVDMTTYPHTVFWTKVATP